METLSRDPDSAVATEKEDGVYYMWAAGWRDSELASSKMQIRRQITIKEGVAYIYALARQERGDRGLVGNAAIRAANAAARGHIPRVPRHAAAGNLYPGYKLPYRKYGAERWEGGFRGAPLVTQTVLELA